MLKKLELYLYTILRMKPSMIAFRLKPQKKLTSVQLSMKRPLDRNKTIVMAETDLAADYLSRFDVESLLKGDLLLLNEWHKFNFETWSVPEASHLWNFNLHYFEYCIPLAAKWAETKEERYWNYFKFLIQSWMDSCKYPRGDAWHPYTISLRLINWLVSRELFADALETDNVFDSAMQESMYAQYRHLLVNQEKHLLANHYLENLKTLVVCALLFGEDDVLARVERDYLTQLDEQVLPDGVHYERSMMYHKLILEGLLRVELAYRSVGKAAPAKVASKARQMLDAIASIERGMGKTPFFNDSADGVAKECGPLACACRDVYGYEPDDAKTIFPESGFYKLYDGDAALIFFAGEPGPSYMLGHAHCDLLSFELSIAGEPTIENSGTYAYQSELRPYFRSTAAHNTATIDSDEQMECWAEHRVARGVDCVRVEVVDERHIVASFHNYKGHLHHRRIELCDGALTVEDSTDRGDAEVVQRYHLAPGCSLPIVPGWDCEFALEEAVCSSEFGKLADGTVVAIVGNRTVCATIPLCNDEGGAGR